MLNAETDTSPIAGEVLAVDPAGMLTSIEVMITVNDDSDEPPAISAMIGGDDVGRVITVEENLTNLAIVDFEAVDPGPRGAGNQPAQLVVERR